MKRWIRSLVPVRVLAAYGESQAGTYASALAFACLLAMFPLMLGILSLLGLAIRDPATEAKAETLIIQMFPVAAQAQLIDALRGVKQSAGWLGLLSLAGLLWSASSIFSTVEFAFARIFDTKQRSMVKQKLMSFGMMVLLVVAVGVTLTANALAALFPFAWITGFLIGGAVMVALLVALYRLVPTRELSLRDVLPGALLAGVLIELFSLGFPLYARMAGGFATYGAQFGLFFLLAAWFYILSDLILMGAVVNKVLVEQREPSAEAARSKHQVA